MANDTKIEPALSAEEWDDVRRMGAAAACEIHADGNEFEAVMAVANAALPDDSPYKITREDVAALGDIDWNGDNGEDISERIRRFAAKLAALLPAE